MTGDFNIRDNNWNLSYSYYLALSDILLEINNSFDLKFSYLVNQVPTQYAGNLNNAKLVIDLIFL